MCAGPKPLSPSAPAHHPARCATDGEACIDSDNGATDPYGDGCAAYARNPSWCGGFDDDDFSSNEMCCACSEGAHPLPLPLLPSPPLFPPSPPVTHRPSRLAAGYSYTYDLWGDLLSSYTYSYTYGDVNVPSYQSYSYSLFDGDPPTITVGICGQLAGEVCFYVESRCPR